MPDLKTGSSRRWPFLASLAAALSLLVAGLAVPAVLVSNLGQSTHDFFSANLAHADFAQAFNSGSGGATLESVEVKFSVAPTNLSVKIVTGITIGGRSQTTVATLANPPSLSAGILTFVAPAGTTISANRSYWVMIEGSSGVMPYTSSDSEDTGGADGWTIDNGAYQKDNLGKWAGLGDSLLIRVNDTRNVAPTVENAFPDLRAKTGKTFNYTFPENTFSDANCCDTLTYTATKGDGSALPDWLRFAASIRIFSGIPEAADVGTVAVKVTASDGKGGTASDSFDIVVAATNAVPTVANVIPDQDATTGRAFSFQFAENTFADADVNSGDTLTYTATKGDGNALPGWLSFAADTRTFSGTPGLADPGTVAVKVTADDGHGGTVSATFDIAVAEANVAPTVANEIPDQGANAGRAFSFQFAENTFSDANSGDTLSYTATKGDGTALPSWLSFDASTRTFSGTPQAANIGTLSVKVTADDSNGGTVSDSFDIVVAASDAPTVANAIPDQKTKTNKAFSYTFPENTFFEPDGDTLTYTATKDDGGGLPSWLSFTASSRNFSGTPTTAETVSVKVTADDGNGGTVSDSFDIVVAVNAVPTVANAIADQDATAGTAFSFQFAADTFADADTGDTLSYTATMGDGNALPNWLSFTASTRTFSGTPALANAGTVTVKVTADDGDGGTVSDTFDIAVLVPGNNAPTVANEIANLRAKTDRAFSYTFPENTFADADTGDTLTYTATKGDGNALPSWLTFDASTRTFSGTPESDDVDTVTVKVTANDGRGGRVSDTFDIVVAVENSVPTVANEIPDQVAIVDAAFTYTFPENTFTDADTSDTLTYTAVEPPYSDLGYWLTFDASTRTFSGTPDTNNAYSLTVEVTADDGDGGTVSDSFDIEVNYAPTVDLEIPDQSAKQGAAFSFQFAEETFYDNDFDTLTYTATKGDGSALPDWLTFAADTRTFSGTPQAANAGTVTVKVTADDGRGGTVSASFDIVAAANNAPTVANPIPDQEASVSVSFSFQFAENTFADADTSDTLTYTATKGDGNALPDWLTFAADTRTFSGRPKTSDVGTVTVTVTADDGYGGTVSDSFDIVAAVDETAPTFSSATVDKTKLRITFDENLASRGFVPNLANSAFTVKKTPKDGTEANAALTGRPSIDSNVLTLTLATAAVDTDAFTVTYTKPTTGSLNRLRDFAGNETANFGPKKVKNITPPPPPPLPAGCGANGPRDVTGGLTLAATATSITVTFGRGNYGSFALCGPFGTNGAIAVQNIGSPLALTFTITHSGRGGTEGDPLTAGTDYWIQFVSYFGNSPWHHIRTKTVNAAPTVANPIPDQGAKTGKAFSYTFPENTFSDANSGDTLTYTATKGDGTGLPSWLSFDAGTRTFSGTTPATAGTVTVKVTADDSKGGTVSDTFDIVAAANNVPTVAKAIPDQAATAGTAFSFQFAVDAFADGDSDTLTYTATKGDGTGLPGWLSFDAGTRTFSGTTPATAGTVTVKVTADDGYDGTVSDSFDIVVAEANVAPTVANPIPNQGAKTGKAFSYTFPENTFSDANSGDTLTYTATKGDGTGLPSWLSFDAGTRTFSGTTPATAGTVTVKVTADDSKGGTVSDTFDIVAAANNVPTVAKAIPDQAATAGTAFSFQFAADAFADGDSDTLTYTATKGDGTGLPGWLSFDAGSRTFTGTPQAANVGTLAVKVTADDGYDGTVSDSFDIVVAEANVAPTVANPIPNQGAKTGKAFSYTFPENTFSDANSGDTLTYTATKGDGTGLPSWLSFDAGTRTFSGTTPATAGTVTVKVTADDSKGGTVSDTFDIVAAANNVPTVAKAIPDQAATAGTAFSFQFAADAFADGDSDTLTYTATKGDGTGLPGWLSFDAGSRTFTGTPQAANVGTLAVKVTADDGYDGTVSDSFDIVVAEANVAPTVANPIPNQGAKTGKAFSYTFPENTFSDANSGDTLTYTATKGDGTGLPSWLSFDAGTRTFSGTTPATAGTVTVKVTADDSKGGTVSDTFDIVAAANNVPTVAKAIPDQAATAGTAFSFQFAADAFADGDSDTLTYTATKGDGTGLPGWLSFDAGSRTFTGTPQAANVGTLAVKVTADDGYDGTVSDSFDIVVAEANVAPTVANPIPNQGAKTGKAFSYTFPENTFSDANSGDTLTYTATKGDGTGLPSWLSFDAGTRTFSGTTPATAGTVTVKVTADDSKGGTVSDTFDIVAAANNVPTVAKAIPDQAATAGTAFSFQFAADAFADGDSDTLTYTATKGDGTGLPGWLSFDAGSRTFTGTPQAANVGTLAVKVTADDGYDGTVSDSFDIVVAEANVAPTVANPIPNQGAKTGKAFSYTFPENTFSDANSGDTLTYTATKGDGTGLPSWLSFDAGTRTFSGTTPATAGTVTVKVTADDSKGGTVSDTFDIVAAANNVPTVAKAIPDQAATAGTAFSFQFAADAFADGDSDTLTYTATKGDGTGLPGWLSFDAGSRTFTGTPQAANVGTLAVKVTADDGYDGTVSDSFDIVVAEANVAPTVANPIPNQGAKTGKAFSYTFPENTFSDANSGDTLTYTATKGDGTGLPSWLSFDAGTRTFSGTTPATAGTVTVKVTADDSKGGTVSDTFDIVAAANNVPTVAKAIPDQAATAGTAFSFQFAADAFADGDSDTLTYTATKGDGTGLPGWLSFDAGSRTFTGTPQAANVGTLAVKVTADDGYDGTVSDSFDIVVAEANVAPTVANPIPNQGAKTGKAFSYTFPENTFSDANSGDTLTYTATKGDGTGLPSWLSFDAGTRTFSGTTPATAGTVTVKVTADDSKGGTVSDSFDIVVAEANVAPTVANPIPNQGAKTGKAFSYTFPENTFSDANSGDTLTYTATKGDGTGLPSWLSFDAGTRTFSGTTPATAGTVTVKVTADDSKGGTVSDTFDIVAAANNVPTVAKAIPDQAATAGTAFSFQFAADAFADGDSDTLTYTATKGDGTGLPGWLSFDAGSRTFTGTPQAANVGTLAVKVTADDGYDGTVSDSFDIVVAEANVAPTVANPIPNQGAKTGKAFSYTFPENTFSDANSGDTLTYTATKGDGTGLPSWLSFDAGTRTFSGTTPATAGTVTVKVTADDSKGGTVSDTFDIVAAANNVPTVAKAIPDQAATAGTAFSFQFAADAFADGDSDTLTYTATKGDGTGLPGWLSFDAGSRTFTGTPQAANVGTLAVKVTADDGYDGTVSDSFDIVVAEANVAPTVANPIPNQGAKTGKAFSYTFPENTFSDANSGDTLTYTATKGDGTGLPSWLSFDAGTRTFSGTTPATAGTVTVKVTADDSKGGTVSDTFDIVAAANNVPTVAKAIPDQAATAGTAFSFQFAVDAFADGDSDTLTYTATKGDGTGLPGWLSFDAGSRTFTGTPQAANVGTLAVKVTADDGYDGTVSDSFDIVVAEANVAPTVANPIPNQGAKTGKAFSYTFPENTFSDANSGDTLTYTATKGDGTGLPSWLSFDAGTRTFSGTTPATAGTVTVKVTADDSKGGTVSDTFDIVAAANNVPTVAKAIPDQAATAGTAFSFQFAADAFADGDSDTLTYTATKGDGTGLPGWLSFDAGSRTFTGTPQAANVGTLAVKVTADDGYDGTVSDSFDIVVAEANVAPTVANPIPNQGAKTGKAFSYTFPENTFSDANSGDTLTYTATKGDGTGLPSWLSFDAGTRTFSGTTPATAGTVTVKVTADDSKGGTVSDTFDIVAAANNVPTVAKAIPDQAATAGTAFSFQFAADAFADGDSDTLTYTATKGDGTGLPGWLSFDAGSRTFTGTPQAANVGTLAVKVTADDGYDGTVSDSFDIVVAEANVAPTVANPIPNQGAKTGKAFSYTFPENTFSDANSGDTLTYTATKGDGTGLPSWLSFDAGTRTFSGTTPATAGTVTVKVTADDSKGGTVSDTFDIVAAANNVPTVAKAIPDQAATAGTAFSFQFAADAFADGDSDTLTYTATKGDGTGLPGWLSFDAGSRTFTGTPQAANVGTLAVKVTADDGYDGTVSDSFDIVVAEANVAPTVANPIPNQGAKTGKAFSYTFPENTFSDANSGDTLTYTATKGDGTGLPSWLSFDAGTRTFSGTTPATAGTVTVKVTADDSKGGTVSDTFDIVAAANNVPTVAKAIPDQAATAGTAFSFQFAVDAFADGDSDTLTYTATKGDGTGLPGWLSFDAGTRTFSGTTPATAGTVTVKVTADDGYDGTVSDSFDIVVAEANVAPTVANPIPNQGAKTGKAFSYTFPENTFSDANSGDTLTYTATKGDGTGLPSWLSFDAGTRTFSGTTPATAGTVTVKVTADDSKGGTVSDTFDIVAAANNVPTVAKAIPDQAATAGTAFSFQFAADAFADGDSDTLTYTATKGDGTGLPGWLSFDAGSRTFTGTPQAANVGTLAVKVTADDGYDGTVSDSFDIVVAEANVAPTVANPIPNQGAKTGKAFSYTFPENTFSDANSGDTLTYTATKGDGTGLPSWLSFDAGTRTFSGTTPATAGTVTVKVTADDSKGGTVSDTFDIVAAANNVPTVAKAIPDQAATAGTAFSFQFAADAFADGDSDTLTYTATKGDGTGLPGWLSFDAGSRTFTGTPQAANVGTLAVKVTADDGYDGTVSDSFDIVVAEANVAPTVANPIPNQGAKTGKAFSYTFPENTFSDANSGDTLTYTATKGDGTGLPSWLSFDAGTRTFSGTTPATAGTVTVKVTADDSKGGTVSDTFDIVAAANNVPTVAKAIPDQAATAGTAFSFQFAADAFADGDSDTLTYTATKGDGTGLPGWLSFDAGSRTFTGTPQAANVGTLAVKVTADDGYDGTVSDSFDIVVAEANVAPTVANPIPNQGAKTGKAFSYTFPENTFSDANSGDTLTYTATKGDGTGLPSWLSFDAGTRTFSGTTPATAGTVTVKVTAE